MLTSIRSGIFRGFVLAALVTGLALAASTSASAASRDFKGWLFALDVALTQPEGLENHIATVSDPTSLPPLTERVLIDPDSDVSWGATLGYNFGLEFGGVEVSYWTFDNDDTQNFSRTGFVAPALFGYGTYGYMLVCNASSGSCDPSLPVAFSGGVGVKAKTLDLDYTQTVDVAGKFSLKWLGGLRTASFDENQSFSAFDGTYTYQQARSWSADAFGIRVGAAGLFHFTEHFGMEAGVSWSEMMANTDGKASQTFLDGGVSCGAPPCVEVLKGKDDNLHGSILDLSLKGVWSAGPVDVTLGLTSSNWQGFVKNPVPANGFLFTSESPPDDSVGFTNFEMGVRWRFGSSHRITSP